MMKTKSETQAARFKTGRLEMMRENRRKSSRQAFEKALEEYVCAVRRAFRLGHTSWAFLLNCTYSLRDHEAQYRTRERMEAFEADQKAQKATRRRSAAR